VTDFDYYASEGYHHDEEYEAYQFDLALAEEKYGE
jgi:hypothetical protein